MYSSDAGSAKLWQESRQYKVTSPGTLGHSHPHHEKMLIKYSSPSYLLLRHVYSGIVLTTDKEYLAQLSALNTSLPPDTSTARDSTRSQSRRSSAVSDARAGPSASMHSPVSVTCSQLASRRSCGSNCSGSLEMVPNVTTYMARTPKDRMVAKTLQRRATFREHTLC